MPLGYEAAGRTLTINEAEARTVRWIFERYLKLGSVHAVMLELEAAAVRSKRRTTKAGAEKGGQAMDRGRCSTSCTTASTSEKSPTRAPAIQDSITFNMQRHLISRPTLRRFRAEE